MEQRPLEFIVDQIDSTLRRELVVGALSKCESDENRASIRGPFDIDSDTDADDVAKLLRRAVVSKEVDYEDKRLRLDLRTALLATARQLRSPRAMSVDRFRAIVDLFRLDRDDARVLVCGLSYRQSSTFESLCDWHTASEKIFFLSSLLRMEVSVLQWHIGTDGRLAKCGIVNPMNLGNPMSFIETDSGVSGYLAGIESRPLTDGYFRVAGPSAYGLNTFAVETKSVRIVHALLKSDTGCHILLHGEPGTGKTEFAKALAAAVGCPAYLVNQQGEEPRTDRRQALHAALGMATGTGGIVIVDEADDILNTRYAFMSHSTQKIGKGWLNDFLDETRLRVIWISNDVSCVEDSTLRRFTYSIKFPPSTVRQRQAVWLDHARRSPLAATVDAELARDLASAYRTSPAGARTDRRGSEGGVGAVRLCRQGHARPCRDRGRVGGRGAPPAVLAYAADRIPRRLKIVAMGQGRQ
jgi:hypothetical protein